MANGSFSWFEIEVPDAAAGMSFYGSVYGWTFHEMEGSGGGYQMIHVGDQAIGALQASENGDPSGRATRDYFDVDDLEGALDRVREGGGSVQQERMEIPGGQWIGVATDPWGQAIGFVTSNAAS